MLLNKEDLAKYMYDPNKLQQVMLENLEASTNGEFVITEPTNPFVMLMELAVTSGANAITEPLSIIRQLYPALAENPSDLYHHVSDSELVSLFSTPATTPMVLYINVKDLYSYGSKDVSGDFVETVLPIGTEITVASTTFTLLNNIDIKLYTEGAVFVEQQSNNELDISVKNLGVLSSGIVNFANGEPWIVFETLVKQVKKHTITKAITPSEGFDVITGLNDKYSYSNIEYKNSKTNNVYTKLTKSHSKTYIDRGVPTCYIEVGGKDVRFKIPDVYLIDGAVSGNIKIDVYETLGKLYLPINKYPMEEYSVNVPSTGTTEAEASINNISILANSRAVLDGGIDSVPLEALKKIVINNSTGAIDVPVTDANVIQKGVLEGFDVSKAIDVLTDRTYVASKNLPVLNISNVYSRPDIYFNTVGLLISELVDTKYIKVRGDYLIIKSGCVFKDTNGSVSVVSDLELNALNALPIDALISETKVSKYFFTPYFYIIDTSNSNDIRSTVYKLDKPYLENVVIKAKNPNVLPKVNIDKYTVELNETGYDIYFSLISNDDFKSTNLDVVKGQLGIKLNNSNEKLYIETTYDKVNNLLVFHIETDLVMGTNNTLVVNNGVSSISSRSIDLISDIDVVIYTLDPGVVDTTNFVATELRYNLSDHTVIFGKEQVTLNLGNKVEHVWNMLYNTYTERKYKKYLNDVVKVYEEDVYNVDPDTGSIFKCVTYINGDIGPEYNILHHAGDTVLDEHGNTVYIHKAGEVILDNGVPVIDTVSGVIRNVDIMMLDYEYKIANSNVYKNYLNTVIDTIDSWISDSIGSINKVLLENTVLLYKSYKKVGKVKITSNNTTYSVDYNIKPTVKLYVKDDKYTGDELANIRYVVGDIIHDTINESTINLEHAKDSIITKLGNNVAAVKITGIDTVNNSDIFNMYDDGKRLVLNKTLSVDTNNDIIVRYDVDVILVNI